MLIKAETAFHPELAGQFSRFWATGFSEPSFGRLMVLGAGTSRTFKACEIAMQLLGTIDLKLRLALRVVALAAFCFLAASAYAVFDSDRSARENASVIARIAAKDLELQQNQLHWIKTANSLYPDLQRIAVPLMAPGLCIAYKSKDGEILQRLCSGQQTDKTTAPALFAGLYRSIFDPGEEILHPILVENRIEGAAVVTLDPASLIAQSWRETSRLLTLMAVTLSALCILVYAALARALRPVSLVLSGLKQLAANDLSARLPAFDLAELSAIRNVFNTLAEMLQTTLAERNELTKRLIAVQDEERTHLARELHDEFGQCLAAISAVAASAGQTARAECPALVPECQTIAKTTAHMMGTLRGALVRLRPPDVDELGLAASLESLVAGWNSRSGGRTRFEFEACGSFEALPPLFGASLYRIAQEGITNASKHAEPAWVGVHLRMREADAAAPDCRAAEIELTVADDGKARSNGLAAKSGMGLVGMRERVAALGGRLSFETRHPAGLILHAVIPAPPMPDSEV
jgi:signal transduction histidine kinase